MHCFISLSLRPSPVKRKNKCFLRGFISKFNEIVHVRHVLSIQENTDSDLTKESSGQYIQVSRQLAYVVKTAVKRNPRVHRITYKRKPNLDSGLQSVF